MTLNAWILSYDWYCEGNPISSQWIFSSDGTWSGESETGSWYLCGNDFVMSFVGFPTLYSGTYSNGIITGTKDDMSGGTGCFTLYSLYGCTDVDACNYSTVAIFDDGTCQLPNQAYYADVDGDGFGAGMSTIACTAPIGYVADNTDCDDNNSAVNPTATEICNAIDDDCDTQIDEGVQNIYYSDVDGDGYGADAAISECTQPVGYVLDNTDCDDNNSAVNPTATEICNAIDDNCSGAADEGLTFTNYYTDVDGDGFGADVAVSECTQPVGYVLDNTDCDDNNSAVNPTATEICNAIDDNCSGAADEGLTFTNYYTDVDGDGFGADVAVSECTQPVGYVLDNTDCDDNNAAVNSGASELLNGVDDNCDGQIDEGVNIDAYTYGYANTGLSLYPNPTRGTDVNINLSGVSSENVQIRVVDAMGRQVWSNRYTVNGLLNINITFEQPLANGLYFVEAIFNGEVQTQRLMVQK
jgi:hypothetical protein